MKDNTSSLTFNLASFAKLQQFPEARRDSSTAEAAMNSEEFEACVSRMAHEMENEIKAEELARYDVRVPGIVVEDKVFRKCLNNEKKRYITASGLIYVERNFYRPPGGGKSICPPGLRAGIAGGLYTPVMVRQIAWIMGNITSVETGKLFEALNGPSSSSCDRLPESVSDKWEKNRVEWETALREQ